MTNTPESLRQRYAAIELVYSERQWPQVESLSHALLLDLPDDPADPLRQRLVLLLGHTRLYGMGDGAAARSHYEAVLRNGAEDTLCEIAQQGLQQCDELQRQPRPQPTQPSGQAGQAFPFEAGPVDELVETGGDAAMPWLQDAAAAGGSPEALALDVDVIEEPEQIEVALADPQRREDLELQELDSSLDDSESLLKRSGGLNPEELEDLSRGLLRVALR